MKTLTQVRTSTPQATTTPNAATATPPAISVVTRTSGHTGAPTLKFRRFAVAWELDITSGHVTVNGEYAGRVIESIPGTLYHFQSTQDAAHEQMWGMFDTASTTAECGAVRAVLYQHHQPYLNNQPYAPCPHTRKETMSTQQLQAQPVKAQEAPAAHPGPRSPKVAV